MNRMLYLAALCSALSLAAFADGETPAAEKPARPMRGPRQMPAMLVIDADTTPEKIDAFKAEVAKKIDEAKAAYAAKEGEKQPIRIMLFSNDGMGPRGMRPGMMGPREGRGPAARGEGRGPRGDRPRRNRPVEGLSPKAEAVEAK